ncbi:MAG TPA: ComEA family DNA-binding protein [Gaiellaceae bacterium]|nr:ComEA family DNA-binding protein [Gaiellaceae bacterium]
MDELPFTRRRALVYAGVVLLVLVVAGRVLLPAGTARSEARAVEITARGERGGESAARRVLVHVVGAVRRPGLYRLEDGARFADAMRAAGGATSDAALEQVNLAAPVADGLQVVVPRVVPAVAGVESVPGGGGASAGPLHLNLATLEELDELPGVGPVTAQKILDYRAKHGAFTDVEQLDAIPGIGPARIEQIRELVVP